MEVILDDLACGAGRLRHPARDLVGAWGPSWEAFASLFHVEQIGLLAGVVEGEQGRGGVARLLLALTEIDGASEDARRGAGLQPLKLNASL